MNSATDVDGFSDDAPRARVADAVDERFQSFYALHFTATARLARLLTGDANLAEDLAQDAFIRVFRSASRAGQLIENPAAFLHTTTVNLCRSWATARRRTELRMVRHGPSDSSVTDDERQLDDSLRRLPYEQRAVIVLRYWLALSEREIATALRCRSGTVKSRHVTPAPCDTEARSGTAVLGAWLAVCTTTASSGVRPMARRTALVPSRR